MLWLAGMDASPPSAMKASSWLSATEAALVLVADIVIVLVLQRAQVFQAAGVTLGWWGVVAPAVLACALAAYFTRAQGNTALPLGPNAVTVMAFGGVVAALGKSLCAVADERCAVELAGFFGAALFVYAILVAVLTVAALRLDLQEYRRVLLMPLAAICWTYLVITPALKLVHEPLTVTLPAVALFALLLGGAGKLIPWLVSAGLWLGLAWLNDDFPRVVTVHAATLPPFAVQAAWGWLVRSELWIHALPIVAPLAVANAFGIIENIAAAREVGDTPSPPHTLGVVTAGTLAASLLGGNAPITVYVGHTAFHLRGAGWLYSALAVPFLIAIGIFGDRLVDLLPTTIFLGAVGYLGAMVGLLPRRHLRSAADVGYFAIVVSPVVVMSLVGMQHPLLAWIGRGGGLTSVAWSFFCFAPRRSPTREGAAWGMAAATLLGLTHAPALGWQSYATAAVYVAAAVALRVARTRYSATMRG